MAPNFKALAHDTPKTHLPLWPAPWPPTAAPAASHDAPRIPLGMRGPFAPAPRRSKPASPSPVYTLRTRVRPLTTACPVLGSSGHTFDKDPRSAAFRLPCILRRTQPRFPSRDLPFPVASPAYPALLLTAFLSAASLASTIRHSGTEASTHLLRSNSERTRYRVQRKSHQKSDEESSGSTSTESFLREGPSYADVHARPHSDGSRASSARLGTTTCRRRTLRLTNSVTFKLLFGPF